MPTTLSSGPAADPAVYYRPVLPNKQSPDKTSTTLRIDLHYAKLGILVRWDWARYTRLARFLNLTIYELASIICLSHYAARTARSRNTFPGPAALLLTLLEAEAMMAYTDDVIRNPLPNLHDQPKGT